MNELMLRGAGVGGGLISPPSIEGLIFWLHAAGLSGYSDNDPVEEWLDVSGSEHHALQETPANQPTYKANVINGLPAVRFNGSDEWLATDVIALPGTFTAWLVCRRTGGAGGSNPINGGLSGIAQYFQLQTFPTDATFIAFDSVGTPFGAAVAWPSANWQLIHLVRDSSQISIDGNLIDPAVTPTTGTPMSGNFKLDVGSALQGTSLFFQGDIAEVLYYDRVLTATEIDLVDLYLARKYLL